MAVRFPEQKEKQVRRGQVTEGDVPRTELPGQHGHESQGYPEDHVLIDRGQCRGKQHRPAKEQPKQGTQFGGSGGPAVDRHGQHQNRGGDRRGGGYEESQAVAPPFIEIAVQCGCGDSGCRGNQGQDCARPYGLFGREEAAEDHDQGHPYTHRQSC